MTNKIEWAVLTKVIENNDFPSLLKAKATYQSFYDPEARVAFNYLQDHYERFGAMPSWLVVEDALHFVKVADASPLGSLLAQLKSKELFNSLSREVKNLSALASSNPYDALSSMRLAGVKLSTQHHAFDVVDASQQAKDVRLLYNKAKEKK